MNKETAEGKFDQVTGKIKQKFGEAVGNERLANSGAADQVKGAAKETWGRTKETAQRVADAANAQVSSERENLRERAEDAAHNLRDKITTATHDAKEKIAEKLDAVKRDRS